MIRRRGALWPALILLPVAVCGCGNRGARPAEAPAVALAAREVRVQHLPPTPKDVLDALLESALTPLSADASCGNVGTQPGDKTIGRYLAGFLAEMSDPAGKNAIETAIEAQQPAAGQPVWICRVMLRHAQGEDVWRWGVQFSVGQTDGRVLPGSFRCLGAG